MKRIIPFLFTVGLIIFLFGCAKDKPLPGGYEKIIGNNEGTIVDTVLVQQTAIDEWFSETVNVSYGTDLLIGSYLHYRSGTYFVFTNLPDSVTIHSAELSLHVKNRFAPGDSSFWDISRQITTKFYLADTTWDKDNPPLPDENLLISSYSYDSDSLDEITIPLDSTLVNQWAAEGSTIQRYGIWMEGQDAEFMMSLYSYESYDISLMPKMTLIYTIPDSTGGVRDTTNFYVSRDGFILLNNKDDLMLNPDKLYIGKGIAFRDFIKFDLSGFDTTVHVNRALLEITANQGNSIRDLFGIEDCIIYRMGDPWVFGNFNEDSLKASYSPTVIDSMLTFDITPTIQGWISKNYENFGFLMKSTYEYESIGRVAFYSSRAEFKLQPKIHLYYTLPADQNF